MISELAEQVWVSFIPTKTTRKASEGKLVREDIEIVLILTRRVGESVKIDRNITVSVLGIKGNQIRLGVDAPKDVPVHREEIYQKMMDQEQSEN